MLLDESMGLSMNTVQRMLGASAVASLGVWYLQGAVMDGVLTLVALSALTAFIWGLSERESTFTYLKLTGSGPWNMLAMVASIVIFAQLSISIWAFPTVGVILVVCPHGHETIGLMHESAVRYPSHPINPSIVSREVSLTR